MLQMGSRTVSIEPQTDLCVASRLTVRHAGFANRSHIICGGISVESVENRTARLVVAGKRVYQYGGSQTGLPYTNEPVPLYPLKRLIGDRKHVHFLKIDTDTVDCYVLQQAIHVMNHSAVQIDAILLESWGVSCNTENLMGKLLLTMVRLGYTAHRTLVFERSWDDHGREYQNNFKRVPMPKGWTEELRIGFNFVLWKLHGSSVTDAELENHPRKFRDWQYLFTKGIDIIQTGYLTREL
jgi:hypothetical protein